MTPTAECSLTRYLEAVERADTLPLQGRVLRVVGLLIESEGPRARLGEVCDIVSGDTVLPAQVVGFRDGTLLTVPLGELAGIRPGDRIIARQGAISVPVGPQLLGRVVDALGRPLDDRPLRLTDRVPLHPPPLNPMQRETVMTPLPTGVRAIDGLLTCGRGQRLGLFGGSGVGKSTLLGMMTRGTAADVIVMALVGERGREVRSFIDHDLGPAGLERSIVVVSTSDNPPLLRMRAASAGEAASRPCTPCSWTATITTSRSPTRSGRFSTVTSCSRGSSRSAITIRRSTSSRVSAGRCRTSWTSVIGSSPRPFATGWPRFATATTW